MCGMKTQTQEITKYVQQLQQLLEQSDQIKQEIKKHIVFSKLQHRIGAIQQQLQFIRSHVLPLTRREKAKFFKHNKLALKLINNHVEEITKQSGESYLKKLEEEEEKWLVIEELREETLRNLEHIEAALKDAERASEQGEPHKEIKEMMSFEGDVAELADKTELLLKEMSVHEHLHGSLFEQIHHLHHELQFIKLHAYSRNHEHETTDQHTYHQHFLNHHYASLHHINEQLLHIHHHYEHLLDELHEEDRNVHELETLRDEIQHTIEQFEEKIKEIEENKIHYIQHPGMHIVPVEFDKE